MCTLSWKRSKDSFHLFFNRDETITRSEALLPRMMEKGQMKLIAPIDPAGGGTWLGVNHAGVVVALVNDYQANQPSHKVCLRSRGLLVLECLQSGDLDLLKGYLMKVDFSVYAGFLLHAFSFAQQGFQLGWNGVSYQIKNEAELTLPISSSSKYPVEAQLYRSGLFKKNFRVESQRDFHRHHDEKNPALSAWMMREDARTHSYSEMRLSEKSAKFWYGKSVASAMSCDALELEFGT